MTTFLFALAAIKRNWEWNWNSAKKESEKWREERKEKGGGDEPHRWRSYRRPFRGEAWSRGGGCGRRSRGRAGGG